MQEKFFDSYTLRARVLPAVLFLLPIAVFLIAWVPVQYDHATLALLLLLIVVLLVPLSQLVRSQGKKVQDKLYDEWGGMPTTVLLRHHDETLDSHTKDRYRSILAEKVSNATMPSAEVEQIRPAFANSQYATAADWLRSNTRNASAFPLVYAENVNYGYRRNLYGIRVPSLIVSGAFVLLNAGFLYVSTTNPVVSIDLFKILSGFISVILFLFWLSSVTREWVKETAFEYAMQLLAACDAIDSNTD